MSAKRKIIYSDVKTHKPCVKFSIALQATKKINIDSVTVIDNNTCFKLDSIHSSSKNLTFLRQYSIEAFFKGNEEKTPNCNSSKNGMLSIFYSSLNKQNVLEIASFMNHNKK
ncbi:hypothetical protein ACOSP6_11995 [Tenacibaculum sp. MEBiC06402]|uniref:hypothetical protein n=1 Tax=unclassified Tenacibaculum TaxID=2635139 RepID=UPI003B9C713E